MCAMNKVFAASDHHFFHRNIIKYSNRPFDFNDDNCVVDNAKMMVERHNQVVSENDLILLVGDLTASLRGRTETLKGLIGVLNGRKVLVRGNHDHLPDQFYLDAGFIDVVQYIHVKDTFICHYPCYEGKWTKGAETQYIKFLKSSKRKNDSGPNGIINIIHGHCHNKNPDLWEPDGYKRTNVCVDYTPNNYYPQELKSELAEKLLERYE